MRILVTGGAGYLGSVLTPALLNEGHHVTVLDNFSHGVNSLAACCQELSLFSVVNGDCRDMRLVKPLLSKADIIIPLAGVVGAPACNRDAAAARSINVGAVLEIVNEASKDQWILFPNTNSGYGTTAPGTECDENTPLKPISLYAETKAQAEAYVMAPRDNSISFRLATVFGVSPRMRFDLMVNDFVLRAYRDKAIVLFDGNVRRNFIHVQDVARVFLHAIGNFGSMRGKVYNAGNSHLNMTKFGLFCAVAEHVKGFNCFDDPVGEDPDKRDYLVSNTRLEATGFRCHYDIDFGIRELLKSCAMIGRGAYGNV